MNSKAGLLSRLKSGDSISADEWNRLSIVRKWKAQGVVTSKGSNYTIWAKILHLSVKNLE